jgi:hypothetical protein
MTDIQPVKLHAKLSASGSEKWMTCTPSAKMEEAFEDESSDFAREGTFAHAVFEQDVLTYLGREVEPLPQELIHFDTPELRGHVADAVSRAIERIEEARKVCKDPIIMVEQRLDFSRWVPEGFGTGDLVIVTDHLVEVMDLKYGKGIFVNAENNSQLRLYGLGAYNELAHLYDIVRVRMTVLQPRLYNYGSEELSIYKILDWAEYEVVPRAKLAWEGKGNLVAGEHCRTCFCRARFQCPARADEALAIAQKAFSLPKPELLTMDQLVDILAKADLALDWLTDVKEFALKQAKEGHKIKGYKLVEGRSNRKYSDQDAVVERLLKAGIDEATIYERSLLGITAMQSALGKKKFEELVGDLLDKPPGKPTLVLEKDKREAIDLSNGFSAIAE